MFAIKEMLTFKKVCLRENMQGEGHIQMLNQLRHPRSCPFLCDHDIVIYRKIILLENIEMLE